MSATVFPHLYTQIGLEEGHNPATLKRAQQRIQILLAKNAYPLLSLRHLAQVTDVNYLFLRDVVQRSTYPYRRFSLDKRTSGKRKIEAPVDELRVVQRWILDYCLSSTLVHPSSFAYAKERSIVECANRHIGARWMLKMDIRNFFGSILERSVFDTFRKQGYSSLVAFELARLCTSAPVQAVSGSKVTKWDSIRTYAKDHQGYLPQGSPTSGALANASAMDLDVALTRLALENGFIYTRYSDDIVMSTPFECGRKMASHILTRAQVEIRRQRFTPHPKKAHVIPPGSRHVVLGLLLTDQKVSLLPEFRRKLDFHIHAVGRYGLSNQALRRNFQSPWSFSRHVEGLIAFAASVDPEWAEIRSRRWNEAQTHSG